MREKCSSVSVRSPCTRMFASSRVDCYLVLPRFSLPPACFSCGLSFFFFFFFPYLPFDARRKSVAAALSSWNGYRSEICNYKLCISLRLDNDAVLASSVFFSAHPRSAAFQGVFGFVFFDLLFRGNRRSIFVFPNCSFSQTVRRFRFVVALSRAPVHGPKSLRHAGSTRRLLLIET